MSERDKEIKRYFGTDGIRGRVGEPPITAEFCLQLGWAVGKVLAMEGSRLVLIGKDTRISGYMIESVLEAGLVSAGVDVRLLHPIPTPAVAYLTRTLRAQAGIVISASHNLYEDNGIKFFDSLGNKLPDATELEIERQLDIPMKSVSSKELGKVVGLEDARARYVEFCKSTVPSSFSLGGMKVVLDCAHGATYQVAPGVFSELGADVTLIGASPNGMNINDHCGSTRPEAMARKVVEVGADVGIAFDGDGDRVIMADHNGEILDGDDLLYVIARYGNHKDGFGGVVGTSMTNLGLEHCLRSHGILFERAGVGDRNVMEIMKKRCWSLGGEPSGHIICTNLSTTGDAIVAALQVLVPMIESAQSLAVLKSGVTKFPQYLVNVRTVSAADISRSKTVTEAVLDVENELGSRGRVLIRPSGTEPVVRVMVEGEDDDEIEGFAETVADVVRNVGA